MGVNGRSEESVGRAVDKLRAAVPGADVVPVVADLATDELVAKKRVEPRRRSDAPVRNEDKGGILGEYGLTEEQGNEIIMAARAHWFEDEDATPQQQEDAVAESEQ